MCGRCSCGCEGRPASGEVLLRYGAKREVCYAPPADAQPALRKLAAMVFDPTGRMRDGKAGAFAEFIEAAREYDLDMTVADGVTEFLAEQADNDLRAAMAAELFPVRGGGTGCAGGRGEGGRGERFRHWEREPVGGSAGSRRGGAGPTGRADAGRHRNEGRARVLRPHRREDRRNVPALPAPSQELVM